MYLCGNLEVPYIFEILSIHSNQTFQQKEYPEYAEEIRLNLSDHLFLVQTFQSFLILLETLFSIVLLLFSVSIFAQSVDLPDLNTVDSVRLVKRNVIENGVAKRKVQFVYIAYKATGDTINAVSPLYDSVAVVAALQSKLASGYEATANAVRAKYEALYGTSEKGNVVFSKMFSRITKTNYPDSTFNANLPAFVKGYFGCGKVLPIQRGGGAHVVSKSLIFIGQFLYYFVYSRNKSETFVEFHSEIR